MSLKSDLAAVKKELARLQPRQSSGMLTSRTTNGVLRRPLRSAAATTAQRTTTTIPVWG